MSAPAKFAVKDIVKLLKDDKSDNLNPPLISAGTLGTITAANFSGQRAGEVSRWQYAVDFPNGGYRTSITESRLELIAAAPKKS